MEKAPTLLLSRYNFYAFCYVCSQQHIQVILKTDMKYLINNVFKCLMYLKLAHHHFHSIFTYFQMNVLCMEFLSIIIIAKYNITSKSNWKFVQKLCQNMVNQSKTSTIFEWCALNGTLSHARNLSFRVVHSFYFLDQV